MEINVENLKDSIIEYSRQIELYENCMLNINNTLNNASNFWNGNKSRKFFDHMSEEKRNFDHVLNHLKNVKEIYLYLISKYEQLGKKIQFSMDYKNIINEKFNLYIMKIDEIIDNYNNLDLSGLVSEKEMILKHKNMFIKLKSRIEFIQNIINNYFERINKIEIYVNEKLSELDINIIKDLEIENYL